MDVTTVKLHKSTKSSLDQLRGEKESYEDVISKLIEQTRKKNLRKELVEGYGRVGKEELQILKEWDNASGGL